MLKIEMLTRRTNTVSDLKAGELFVRSLGEGNPVFMRLYDGDFDGSYPSSKALRLDTGRVVGFKPDERVVTVDAVLKIGQSRLFPDARPEGGEDDDDE